MNSPNDLMEMDGDDFLAEHEDGYKTPDHWDFLFEQYKDDLMIAKFDKEFK